VPVHRCNADVGRDTRHVHQIGNTDQGYEGCSVQQPYTHSSIFWHCWQHSSGRAHLPSAPQLLIRWSWCDGPMRARLATRVAARAATGAVLWKHVQ
jgi:hypothetical protein